MQMLSLYTALRMSFILLVYQLKQQTHKYTPTPTHPSLFLFGIKETISDHQFQSSFIPNPQFFLFLFLFVCLFFFFVCLFVFCLFFCFVFVFVCFCIFTENFTVIT